MSGQPAELPWHDMRTPQEATDKTAAAIDVIARAVMHQIVVYEADFDLWGSYPLIGEHDWKTIVDRVGQLLIAAANPAATAVLEAYDHLATRADR